jgi:hypothetical protein
VDRLYAMDKNNKQQLDPYRNEWFSVSTNNLINSLDKNDTFKIVKQDFKDFLSFMKRKWCDYLYKVGNIRDIIVKSKQ